MTREYRIEKDSMGEVKVPADALYQAQTQRAVDKAATPCLARLLLPSPTLNKRRR